MHAFRPLAALTLALFTAASVPAAPLRDAAAGSAEPLLASVSGLVDGGKPRAGMASPARDAFGFPFTPGTRVSVNESEADAVASAPSGAPELPIGALLFAGIGWLC